MTLREIVDKSSQKPLNEIFNNALEIIFIIIFEGVYVLLKTFFFPSGNLAIEIIIILGNIHAVFRMGYLVTMDIFKKVYEVYNEIKKMKTWSRKSHKIP